MRILTVVFTTLLLIPSWLYAQDSVAVDPAHYQIILENEHVRVLRITYGPGEPSVMHEHPASVAVFLTDSSFQMTLPDGKVEPADGSEQGSAVWADAATHLPENAGNTAAELILIELKNL